MIRNDLIKFDYASAAGIIDIYFSTNGILLNEKISEKLIKSGLTRLQVSIDAVTQETYDKVRPGGSLQKVIKNLDNFLNLKIKLKSPTPLVRVNFVKTNQNEFELNFKILGKKVDMIGVQEFIKPTKLSMKLKVKKTFKKKNFKCSFPFKQLVINNEQQVLPCCTFLGRGIGSWKN